MRKARKTEQPKQIAVIEEIADSIYSIKFVLQSLGYGVISLACRDEYKDSLKKFSPNLIIVDMMIPGGMAFEIIRSLRKGALKKVPVLAITAEAMEGTEQEVYKAGVQDTLAKPYTVADLQKKLKKWLK